MRTYVYYCLAATPYISKRRSGTVVKISDEVVRKEPPFRCRLSLDKPFLFYAWISKLGIPTNIFYLWYIFLDWQKLTGTRSDGTLAHIKTYKVLGVELVMILMKALLCSCLCCWSSWRSRVTMCARTIPAGRPNARASGPCAERSTSFPGFMKISRDTGMQSNFPVYSRKFRDGW